VRERKSTAATAVSLFELTSLNLLSFLVLVLCWN
jgi:hypothetical protein